MRRLRQSLADMVAAEAKDRDQLRARITNLAEKLEEEDCPEEQYQCCVCKAFSYLSQVTCKCTKLVACLEHADQLCACSSSSRVMRKRYSESQLEEILAIVETRAAIPGAWRERFEAVLSTRRPMLKTMRGLLTDGERMPYPLTELNDLRIMVARANAWVDRVQTLSQRKTAVGRRRKRQETDDD
jgi:histone demethylase JARID1